MKRDHLVLNLLTFETALVFFFVPAGRFAFVLFGFPLTFGYDVYKNFPVLILTWLWWRRDQKEKPWPTSPLFLPMILLFLVSLLSAVGSSDIYQAVTEVLELGAYILFFLILLDIPWTPPLFLGPAVAFILGNLYLGGVALHQYFLSESGNQPVRISATFTHPNALGIYSILGVTLLLWLFTMAKKIYQKTIIGITLAFLILSALLTLSRTTYIALLVWSLMFLIFGSPTMRKFGIAFLMIGIGVILFRLPHALTRFAALYTDLPMNGEILRFYIWDFLMDQEIPSLSFFGLGMGPVLFDRMADRLVDSPMSEVIWGQWGSHNGFLDQLITTGIPGLFALIWLFHTAGKQLQRCPGRTRVVLQAGLIGFLVHLLFAETLLYGNIPVALFTLLAVGNYFSQNRLLDSDTKAHDSIPMA